MDIITKLIGHLVENGRLGVDGLEQFSRLRSTHSDIVVPELLSRLGLVSESDLASAWSSLLGWPRYGGQYSVDSAGSLPSLTERFLKHFALVPIGFSSNEMLDVVSSRPISDYPFKAIEYATGLRVQRLVGLQSEVEQLIECAYGQGRTAMGTLTSHFDDTVRLDDIDHLKDLASEAPVIKLVNLILQRAVELLASDVHIEPFENRLTVRYRVDGLLRQSESPPISSAAAVISRI